MAGSSSEYPYNVIPQYRSPEQNTGPVPCLKCPPDNSIKAILLDCTKVSVVKGANTESSLDLKEWFVPITNYNEFEYVIPASTASISLDYGMTAVDGKVKFILIYPQYLLTELEQINWNIQWKFTGESEFRTLGRILVLNGTDTDRIDPITLGNPQGENIPLRILLAT